MCRVINDQTQETDDEWLDKYQSEANRKLNGIKIERFLVF